jgi:hypothetical protein
MKGNSTNRIDTLDRTLKRNRNTRKKKHKMHGKWKQRYCLLRRKVIQYNSINTTCCWNQITKPSIQVWTQWIQLPKYLMAVHILMVWSNIKNRTDRFECEQDIAPVWNYGSTVSPRTASEPLRTGVNRENWWIREPEKQADLASVKKKTIFFLFCFSILKRC